MRQIVFSLLVGTWLAAAMPDVSAQMNQVSLTLDQETKKMLREATEERWFKNDSFVSALLGGALALAGGLVAPWHAAFNGEVDLERAWPVAVAPVGTAHPRRQPISGKLDDGARYQVEHHDLGRRQLVE